MEAPLLEEERGFSRSFREDESQWSLWERTKAESKRLWKIAGPAICTSICQYSLGALTQTFVGHVGDLQLAAVSVANSVVSGLAFGVMVTAPFLSACSAFSFFLELGIQMK